MLCDVRLRFSKHTENDTYLLRCQYFLKITITILFQSFHQIRILVYPTSELTFGSRWLQGWEVSQSKIMLGRLGNWWFSRLGRSVCP